VRKLAVSQNRKFIQSRINQFLNIISQELSKESKYERESRSGVFFMIDDEEKIMMNVLMNEIHGIYPQNGCRKALIFYSRRLF
jgi:hypothetical protein